MEFIRKVDLSTIRRRQIGLLIIDSFPIAWPFRRDSNFKNGILRMRFATSLLNAYGMAKFVHKPLDLTARTGMKNVCGEVLHVAVKPWACDYGIWSPDSETFLSHSGRIEPSYRLALDT